MLCSYVSVYSCFCIGTNINNHNQILIMQCLFNISVVGYAYVSGKMPNVPNFMILPLKVQFFRIFASLFYFC